MPTARIESQTTISDKMYRALLAVSGEIISHRDTCTLFHDLAPLLQPIVPFDFLAVVLHEAASDTMRLHILETNESVPFGTVLILGAEEDPAGLVWQTQQPLIISSMEELRLWPRLLERVQPYGVQSFCWLPLTTARQRLGTLVFTSKQPSSYVTRPQHLRVRLRWPSPVGHRRAAADVDRRGRPDHR
jgi:formate hydrogenlyase transcriptional activator